jgi:hypothetical protein
LRRPGEVCGGDLRGVGSGGQSGFRGLCRGRWDLCAGRPCGCADRCPGRTQPRWGWRRVSECDELISIFVSSTRTADGG